VARTVCRRAERRVVSLSHVEPGNPHILTYLNRLGDLLFVMARAVNTAEGVQDIIWEL
jgi:cob(I)alamin adenosyltransferase